MSPESYLLPLTLDPGEIGHRESLFFLRKRQEGKEKVGRTFVMCRLQENATALWREMKGRWGLEQGLLVGTWGETQEERPGDKDRPVP